MTEPFEVSIGEIQTSETVFTPRRARAAAFIRQLFSNKPVQDTADGRIYIPSDGRSVLPMEFTEKEWNDVLGSDAELGEDYGNIA